MDLRIIGLFLILRSCIVSGESVEDLQLRVRALERSLQRTKSDLYECHRTLEAQPDTLVGKAFASMGQCLSGPPEKQFKPFVSEVLQLLDLESGGSGSEHRFSRSITFTTSTSELQTLRRFVLYDDVRFTEVREILLSSLERREETRLPGGFSFLHNSTNRIHPALAVAAIAGLLVCVVLVPLLLGARKRLILLVLLAYCILHTWIGEYWKAVAKKESVLAKHGASMKQCRLEKKGYAASVASFFSGMVNGQQDPCEEYYRASLVDPLFEVNLVHALVESFSQLLGVLGGLGQGLGNFVNNFISPLPLVWKVPALVVGAITLILVLLVISGYQFSTLLFSIGPSHKKEKPVKRAVKNIKKLAIAEDSTDEEEGTTRRRRKSKALEGNDVERRDGRRLELKEEGKGSVYPGGFHAPPGVQLHQLVDQGEDRRPAYPH